MFVPSTKFPNKFIIFLCFYNLLFPFLNTVVSLNIAVGLNHIKTRLRRNSFQWARIYRVENIWHLTNALKTEILPSYIRTIHETSKGVAGREERMLLRGPDLSLSRG